MTSRTLITACCLMLFAAALCFAPEQMVGPLRGAVCDLLRPGLGIIRSIRNHFDAAVPGSEIALNSAANLSHEMAQLYEALESEQEKNRALQVRMAQIVEQRTIEGEIMPVMNRSERLLVPNLIDVAVLSETVGEPSRSGHLLEQGKKHGLRENELVLLSRKSSKSIIDIGEDTGVSIEDTLLLGRCVIGKVDHVGQWTSSCLLVTDARYRGRAQLIRETSDGLFAFEAQGILKGQGEPLCRLEGIPAESSVRVGDSVYSAERDGVLPTPLYYGQVVQASLGSDHREWTVLVKPVALPTRLTTVQLLRTVLNPERLAVK